MEEMTRDQMLAEFGQPGVENAKVVDLITLDAATDKVVLVMIERRPWGASPQQFGQIEEKINRYLGYVLDGYLAEHYPQYEGRRVTIRLDCAEEPHGEDHDDHGKRAHIRLLEDRSCPFVAVGGAADSVAGRIHYLARALRDVVSGAAKQAIHRCARLLQRSIADPEEDNECRECEHDENSCRPKQGFAHGVVPRSCDEGGTPGT